jgi:ATP-dependent protease HslVU (ClpYQ) peptidase subunit
MAGDGRALIGQLITTEERVKIIHAKDGSVVGVAGDSTAGQLVREWFANGADNACIPVIKPGEEPGTPFEAIVLRHDGRVEYLDWNFTLTEQAVPCAIGSGREVAVGAMLAGKTPEQALELVKERVASVGGTVLVLEPRKEHD